MGKCLETEKTDNILHTKLLPCIIRNNKLCKVPLKKIWRNYRQHIRKMCLKKEKISCVTRKRKKITVSKRSFWKCLECDSSVTKSRLDYEPGVIVFKLQIEMKWVKWRVFFIAFCTSQMTFFVLGTKKNKQVNEDPWRGSLLL